MAKFVDKFLNMMRLNDDYDEDYDDYDDEEEDNSSRKKRLEKIVEVPAPEQMEERRITQSQVKTKQSKSAGKVVPIRSSKSGKYEICAIKPSTVEDAREITDTLLSGRAVVLILEGLQLDMAQRIIDFTSGSCYSINGNLQKVSSYIFMVTPESVDMSGDFQDILGEFDVASLNY